MGGGDDHEPYIGSTTDESTSDVDSEEDEPRPTALDDHQSEPDSEETEQSEPESDTDSDEERSAGGGGGAGAVSIPSVEDGTTEPEEAENEDTDDSDETEEHSTSESDPSEKTSREQQRKESDETDDEEDTDQQQDVQIVVHSDAWDDVGFGLYPIRYQLKEEYGDKVSITDAVVAVREFDQPQQMAQNWQDNASRHEMPIDSSIWNSDPPESTELSNRVFKAAREQSRTLAKKFIRRLRIESIAAGQNIEDEEKLMEIAREVGLDTRQLHRDWEAVDVSGSRREATTPKTTIHIDGETVTQTGYLHIDDIKMMLGQIGLEEGDPQPVADFVAEYGPVATKEVQQVYDLTKQEAIDKFQQHTGIRSVGFGEYTFWKAP